MGLRRIFVLVIASFTVSLTSYFLFNRFILRAGPGSAALSVNSNIGSLTVSLNGEVLGKTPYYSDTLKAGEPSLVLSDGESIYKAKIHLTDGALTVVSYSLGPSEDFSEGEIVWLEKSPDPGALLVISDPDEAKVYLDEILVGTTPFSTRNVANGERTLKVAREGYRPRLIKIQAQPGFKLNLKARLFLLPVSAGAGQLAFENEPRFKIYDFSSSNPALYTDSSAWAKGIVFYTQKVDREASPSAFLYQLYVDYKGQVFDQTGIKTSSPAPLPDPEIKVAYLGRQSDEGLSDDANRALTGLAQKVLPHEDKVQILPTGTGWLRVRQQSGVSSPEIAKVNEGDKLTLLGEEGTFYKVKLSDGTEGFVSKNFARRL